MMVNTRHPRRAQPRLQLARFASSPFEDQQHSRGWGGRWRASRPNGARSALGSPPTDCAGACSSLRATQLARVTRSPCCPDCPHCQSPGRVHRGCRRRLRPSQRARRTAKCARRASRAPRRLAPCWLSAGWQSLASPLANSSSRSRLVRGPCTPPLLQPTDRRAPTSLTTCVLAATRCQAASGRMLVTHQLQPWGGLPGRKRGARPRRLDCPAHYGDSAPPQATCYTRLFLSRICVAVADRATVWSVLCALLRCTGRVLPDQPKLCAAGWHGRVLAAVCQLLPLPPLRRGFPGRPRPLI
jgi:hypothetical protein